MPPRLPSWILVAVAAIVLVASFTPYLYAASAAGEGYRFGGFLLNPIDGNSYLAKMRLGWQGEWQFTLPYTAEVGQGSYLFLFYLFLGHLSRWLTIPLVWTFHIARFLAVLLMLVALFYFYRAIFPEVRLYCLAFILAAIGSGMGWLGLLFGGFTADFWVAEAYPFLSAYANPHFPLGLGLLLLIFLPAVLPSTPSPHVLPGRFVGVISRPWISGLLALLLAIIAPFGVVIALSVLTGSLVWAFFQPREGYSPRSFFHRLVWVGVGGVPLLVYDLWITVRDPLLSSWNAQNLTPSPPLWDLVVSLSPLLIFAALGAGWLVVRDQRGQSNLGYGWRIPLVWLVLALLLMVLPVGLQRRFMMGLYVPLALFAAAGITWLSAGKDRKYWMLSALVVLLVLPTNLVVLLTARYGVQSHDPLLYLSQAEAQAIDWLEVHTTPDALVLAAPATGMFIPAHSGRRVIYGHPFETVSAAEEEKAVESFFSHTDAESQRRFLNERGVAYVFDGPRERQLGGIADPDSLQLVFQVGDVVIYAVPIGGIH